MLMKAWGALADAATRYRFWADRLFADARFVEDWPFGAKRTAVFLVLPPSISASRFSSQAWRIGEIR